ncbi:hypothetical protein PR048_030872 [Dryococelus australis]|uniref:Uncharacterized protein n=1 Tax=Dryococelus australis TaxID=614101 RepID=A0ABQ9GAJ5_9NEOP|nr:hypothetical protein PR048_030872 [Dryococelus australis]
MLNIVVSRADEGAASECKGGRRGDSRENPSTSGIIRQDSHLRKSGSDTRRESNPIRLARFLDVETGSVVGVGRRLVCGQRGGEGVEGGSLACRYADRTTPFTTTPKSSTLHISGPGRSHVGIVRTMPLVSGFSRGSPVSPALSFRRCFIPASITLVGSQDLDVKSRPNLFTHVFSLLGRSSVGMRGRGKREIPKKTRGPAASSATIRTYENGGIDQPRLVPPLQLLRHHEGPENTEMLLSACKLGFRKAGWRLVLAPKPRQAFPHLEYSHLDMPAAPATKSHPINSLQTPAGEKTPIPDKASITPA